MQVVTVERRQDTGLVLGLVRVPGHLLSLLLVILAIAVRNLLICMFSLLKTDIFLFCLDFNPFKVPDMHTFQFFIRHPLSEYFSVKTYLDTAQIN